MCDVLIVDRLPRTWFDKLLIDYIGLYREPLHLVVYMVKELRRRGKKLCVDVADSDVLRFLEKTVGDGFEKVDNYLPREGTTIVLLTKRELGYASYIIGMKVLGDEKIGQANANR